jgi:hypothetical protein
MCLSKPKMPEMKVTASPTQAMAKNMDPKLELADVQSEADTIRKKLKGKRGLRIGKKTAGNQVGTSGLTNKSVSIPTK